MQSRSPVPTFTPRRPRREVFARNSVSYRNEGLKRPFLLRTVVQVSFVRISDVGKLRTFFESGAELDCHSKGSNGFDGSDGALGLFV
jgi:hypothetical protein